MVMIRIHTGNTQMFKGFFFPFLVLDPQESVYAPSDIACCTCFNFHCSVIQYRRLVYVQHKEPINSSSKGFKTTASASISTIFIFKKILDLQDLYDTNCKSKNFASSKIKTIQSKRSKSKANYCTESTLIEIILITFK